jgi:magnesium transporter
MISIFTYDTQKKEYRFNLSVVDIPKALDDENIFLWVDFESASEAETAVLKSIFNFDDFAIEDCIHPRQSPKLESFSDYHFFIVQGMRPPEKDEHCATVELDGFLGDRYLVTFHDEPLFAIENAKKHLHIKDSRLAQGTAYLGYEILDQIIDMYIPVLDYFDDKLQQIQSNLAANTMVQNSAAESMRLSSQILELRRTSHKNQQVFHQFSLSPLQFIDPEEARLFRDIYDHVVRVVDMSDYYQQSLREALNIQFSLNSNKVNQVLLFLTVFSTIMLPLNVITGIYGMNFVHMPLLHHPEGFWLIIAAMFAVVALMLFSFRRYKWL